MERIWFNHWFSTAYHFIDMLKNVNYYVIGTNKRENCIYKANVNEFYIEKEMSDSEYVEWALNFCKEHKINIFFVELHMREIIKNVDRFKEINVNVICEDNIKLYDIFNSKIKTKQYMDYLGILKTPDMMIVNNVEEFKQAYETLSKKYNDICIKFDEDEGGLSYKKIVNKRESLTRICENNGLSLSYDYIIKCLSSVNSFKDLIVMPYLEGPEISIDCLGLGNDLLAIPRYKLADRTTKIDLDKELIYVANDFYRKVKLQGPFNLQFRYLNNTLYLLEVNTRLSGGSWKDSLIGIEFPILCVKKAQGKLDKLPRPTEDSIIIGKLEDMVILSHQ